jgi:uncharacterized membrane protein YhaH (DUF805 family)
MSETRQSSLLFLAVKPFRDCLSFAGRSTRSELFAFLGLGMAANAVRVSFLHDPFTPPSVIEICWTVLWSFPLLALTVRRLHDQGRSAWWLLVHGAAVLAWTAAALLPQGTGAPTFTLMLWQAQPVPGGVSLLLSFAFPALIVWMFVLDFLPPEAEQNRYGPNPRPEAALA